MEIDTSMKMVTKNSLIQVTNMKYIRTKDRIIEIPNGNKDEKGYYTYDSNNFIAPKKYIDKKDIIKKADIIEEVFDDIVINEKNGRGHLIANCLREQREYRKEFNRQDIPLDKEGLYIHNRLGNPVYGGIWTDKGFKYVAKMNSDGEFELIK